MSSIITVSKEKVQTDSWQDELRAAKISLKDLLTSLDLNADDFKAGLLPSPDFKLKVSPSYLRKIETSKVGDPLLLQILPQQVESLEHPDFLLDPLAEGSANKISGLIQKYHARALLITSAVCPVHCRYCFRKDFSYQDNLRLESALVTLKLDTSIFEVILSGGDPLSLDNQKLSHLIHRLEEIPHIKTLRIHTRFPVAIPARLDIGLFEMLAASRFNLILVSHINHPQEIDSQVIAALKPFKSIATLLNQSVLLAKVNDDADIQIKLSKKLLTAGIVPYYLHQLDKVQGTTHFLVDDNKAIEIIKEMQSQLPGYLVPKLVREAPGQNSKMSLMLGGG